MDWERKGFLSDSMTKPLLHAGNMENRHITSPTAL